jgi:hypothetical protein
MANKKEKDFAKQTQMAVVKPVKRVGQAMKRQFRKIYGFKKKNG